MDVQNLFVAGRSQDLVDARRQPRYKMEGDITVYSRTCGLLKGRIVDISESGIAVMLRLEVRCGELIELNFALNSGSISILATVRQRNAFRYGFEFVNSEPEHELIRRACRDLAVGQPGL